jgi:hypothetical protein
MVVNSRFGGVSRLVVVGVSAVPASSKLICTGFEFCNFTFEIEAAYLPELLKLSGLILWFIFRFCVFNNRLGSKFSGCEKRLLFKRS